MYPNNDVKILYDTCRELSYASRNCADHDRVARQMRVTTRSNIAVYVAIQIPVFAGVPIVQMGGYAPGGYQVNSLSWMAKLKKYRRISRRCGSQKILALDGAAAGRCEGYVARKVCSM